MLGNGNSHFSYAFHLTFEQSSWGLILYGRLTPHLPGRLVARSIWIALALEVTPFKHEQSLWRSVVDLAALNRDLIPLHHFGGALSPLITIPRNGYRLLYTLLHEVCASVFGVTATMIQRSITSFSLLFPETAIAVLFTSWRSWSVVHAWKW